MKRIAIDMDEVIVAFSAKHLAIYNKMFGDQLAVDDLNGQRLWQLRPHLSSEILTLVDDPHFFRDLQVIDGSQQVIRDLYDHYEIFIATAAVEHPTSFAAKYEWLKEHFPFLADKNFVFCGDKSIIHADYLIDDSVRHFERFVGQGILYTAAHNVKETGYVRVNNWEEVRAFFLGGDARH